MSNGNNRIVTITLVCSLAINLLLVGGIVGHFLAGPPAMMMPPHLGWIFRQLDDDKRRELSKQFDEKARQATPLRREMRDAQHEFEAALTAPELNETRLAESLERLRVASEAFQQNLHTQMIGVLSQLNVDERRRVVRFLHQHRPGEDRGPGVRRGRPPDPDDLPEPP